MDKDAIETALAPFNLDRMLDGIHAQDGVVRVSLAVSHDDYEQFKPLRIQVEQTLAALPGVKAASVFLTSHRGTPTQDEPAGLSGVKNLVAVASGKGGVGKSTIAVNLAVSLAQQGLSVGLLDADIYGPSLPHMLGAKGKPQLRDGRIIPLEAWGMKCMSIGFLVETETAMVWRGPMVASALTQMLNQVAWGTLDVLVIDMPPGTGDVQLTLAQKAPLAGAVIVSTPQDIALIDARRGVTMFGQVGVPVLGLIENMAYFCCPHCEQRTEIFGHGGAAAEAARIGVDFLGEVPLLPVIREAGDTGVPVATQLDSTVAAIFREIGRRVNGKLAAKPQAGPRIRMED